jgi:methylenetetrahydrofolate dehydrogenase (NADP+)/methenyltetrahydrofolate cyclohydrolase
MLINGKHIAEQIFSDLKQRVSSLNFTPKLGVILVGEDPASEAYVMQKQLKADNINAEVAIFQFPIDTQTETLLDKIRSLNSDSTTHGIIVQRPLPPHINTDVLQEEIDESKDVDGFKSTSPFHVPVVLAVLRILNEVYVSLRAKEMSDAISSSQIAASPTAPRNDNLLVWLKTKQVVLIGKGSTAGKPLMDYLNEMGVAFQSIDSKTENPEEITKQADIIISSVGKGSIITREMIKPGVVLIGIGIFRGEDGKLHGDYEEEQIKDIAAFYTPTPGGVGPINVAMLLENLVMAAENSA